MNSRKIKLRKIGDEWGVFVPKSLLKELKVDSKTVFMVRVIGREIVYTPLDNLHKDEIDKIIKEDSELLRRLKES